MAKLPTGRGGSLSAGITLLYNSKPYDSHIEVVPDQIGRPVEQNHLASSQEGGWRYGISYQLQLFNRLDQYTDPPQCGLNTQSPDLKATYIWKLKMSFPDGSIREFRPTGYTDALGDGYYDIRPDGWRTTCSGTGPMLTTTMTYYSSDGSYLRLDIEHDADSFWGNNSWTLYFPDSGRVTGGSGNNRIKDRNNNLIRAQNITYNNHPATRIIDDLDRAIIIEYDTALKQDYIYQQGVGNEQLRWTVKWKDIFVNKTYYTTRGNVNPQTLQVALTVVDQIILPTQAGGLSYRFGYNRSS